MDFARLISRQSEVVADAFEKRTESGTNMDWWKVQVCVLDTMMHMEKVGATSW